MKMKRLIATSLLLAGLQGSACLAQVPGSEVPREAGIETVRPQLGIPLKAAQAYLEQNKPALALKKLSETDAIADLTDWEKYSRARIGASAAALSGDDEVLIKALLVILSAPYLSAQERTPFEQALVAVYFRAKQYTRLIDYMSTDIQAGKDPELRGLLAFAYFQVGDFKNASVVQANLLHSPEGAEKAAAAENWTQLASSCLRAGDRQCYLEALEKIAALQYSGTVMREALHIIAANSNYANRIQVEAYRLRQKIVPLNAVELLDFSRLLLMDGAPAEATVLVETAFKNGSLGKGADAPRHERLKALVANEYARSISQPESVLNSYKHGGYFDKIVELGYDMVHTGQVGKGIELIEFAIASAKLNDPAVAKLHLGLAYAAAGRYDESAVQLNSIPGDDGLAQLGRLWVIQNKQSMKR
ncbi:hypothetical protein DUGA6_61540 [Duganella sp. HH105]|nr:hypothetical protein DUGA6_61540 [Duganella sp. HH105]